MEVARGQPTALVAASAACAVCATPRSRLFTVRRVRVYTNERLVGVEVGGAVKNVLAIATGIADGLRSASMPAPRSSRAAWRR